MRSKKWTGIFVCLLLCICMFPVTAFAADPHYAVTVNGNAITESNADDVLGDGTVSYDADTNTLTMNGADLTQIQNNTGKAFTIQVSGTNKVAITSGQSDLIKSDAPLMITGEKGATLTLSGTNQNSYISCINAQGSVTVEIITLVLTNSSNAGISTTGDITVQENATVKGDTGYMFYATTSGAGKLTIKDSTVTAPLEGTSVSGWMSAWVNEMEISNSTVDIVVPNGIFATGDIVINSKSNVKVTADGTATPYPGIYAGGSMTITDSEVEGVSYTFSGLYAVKDLTITGGKVKAVTTSTGYAAMRAKGNLTINGPVTIETETASGVSYLGDQTFAVRTPSEPADTMYEVYTGTSEADAVEIESSPLAADTNVTDLVKDSLYFRIAAHTHAGGTATCDARAVCSSCGNKYGEIDPENHANLKMIEERPATHLAEGNILYYYCDRCQKYFSDNAGTAEITFADTVTSKLEGHTVDSTGWHADADGHWNTCECGEKLNETAHTFKWMTDKEATATEAGSKHEECAVCGYKKAAVEIPAIGTTDDKENETTDKTEEKDTTGKTTDKTTDKTSAVQTGVTDNATLWTSLLLLAAVSLGGTLLYSRKRDTIK